MHPRSRSLLLLLLLVGGGLLALSWSALDRDARARARHADPAAGAGMTAELAGIAAAQRRTSPREARDDHDDEPAAEATPAPAAPRMEGLSGRITIDGLAPEGTLALRSADGAWAFTARVLPDGSFGFGHVPCTELALRFEPDPTAAEPPRRLVLPPVAVRPADSGFEPLRIDWRSKHVNLRVLDEQGAPAADAVVTIQGAGCEETLAADGRGKARLGLVADGTYAVRASRDGVTGEGEVRVGTGNGLESLVLRLSATGVH